MGCLKLNIENSTSLRLFNGGNWVVSKKDENLYRYGFNGQEKDNEIAGEGNSMTAEFWQYSPRIGRRWNQDPKPNPSISNYSCFANNPILYSDPEGDTIRIPNVAARVAVLKMINSKALGTFAINATTGELYLEKATGNPAKFSKYYQDKLVEAINDGDVININIGSTYVINGVTKDVDIDAGGGATIYTKYVSTNALKGPVEVTISGNDYLGLTDVSGAALTDKPADILAHELVGHAIPATVGTDTGNAVENENKIRAENPITPAIPAKDGRPAIPAVPAPLRAPEPSHVE